MNYFEYHIGDYDKATAHLTACEDGIYGRLLRRYYDTESPLPNDLKAIQRLVRARAKDEREAVKTVLDEFFELTDEGWRHKRCDLEIARYQEKRDKAKRSAEARWANKPTASERNANASADAMRTHTDGNATVMPPVRGTNSPDTRHQTPVTNTGVGGTPQPRHAISETPPPPVPIRTIGDWNPKPAVVEALCSNLHNVPRQFVDEQILEFRTYWGDRGGSADSWDAKFLTRCSGEWKRNGHTWRAAPKPTETGNAFDRLQDRSWAAGLELSDDEQPDVTARLLGAGGDA